MRLLKETSSQSRTYIIPVYGGNFNSISFKKFKLPEDYDNNSTTATWYFYNRLDFFHVVRLLIRLKCMKK